MTTPDAAPRELTVALLGGGTVGTQTQPSYVPGSDPSRSREAVEQMM